MQNTLLTSSKIEAPTRVYQTKSILFVVAALHLIGLLACVIDYYYLQWYVVNYNEGLIPDQQKKIWRELQVSTKVCGV